MSLYAATPLIVALSPGHNDITRFRPWSPIDRGNLLDCSGKDSKFAQTIGTVDVFYPRSDITGPTSRRASACPNLHKWLTQPAHVRCAVAQLLIWPNSGGPPRLAREFDQWSPEWSLFWVVQDEAHHRWKNHHVYTGLPSFWRWHTMVHVPLMFESEWC